jgi:hypothetical protein
MTSPKIVMWNTFGNLTENLECSCCPSFLYSASPSRAHISVQYVCVSSQEKASEDTYGDETTFTQRQWVTDGAAPVDATTWSADAAPGWDAAAPSDWGAAATGESAAWEAPAAQGWDQPTA